MRRPVTLYLAAMVFGAAACEQPLAPTAPTGIGEARGVAQRALIAHGSVATAVNAQSGESSLTIARPSAVAAGDLLLAQITFEKGADISTLVAPSAGWQLVRRTNSIDVASGTDLGQAVFWKLATEAEPADYTWQFRRGSAADQVRAAGAISRYTGVDPFDPIVASSGAAGDGTVLTAPSIDVVAKSRLVAFFGHKKLTALSNSPAMVDAYHVAHSNQSGPTVRSSDETLAAGGSTGERTSYASATVGADKWVAQLVGLRAAATVTVIKVVEPANDGGLFDLQVNGITRRAGARNGDGTGQVIVPAGSVVTVGELAGSADTDLDDYESSVSCDTGKGSNDGTTHTFSIAAGDDVICTITNKRKATGLLFYLHNRATQPSTSTTSLANLPMNATVPTNAGALPNYDTNRDSRPGRLIQKNSPSATQSDLGKYQNWVTPAFGAAYTLYKSSNAQVTIWTAMKDQTSDKTGRIRVYVRHCPGVPQTGCVVIGQGDFTRPRGSAFSLATVSVSWTFAATSYTVPAGHVLEVKVVVRDTSDDDMWFGYDTAAMPASFVYPQP